MTSPLFFSLDGIDGTGKSTQCRLLAEWLRGQGREVVTCADPGGTPVGDQLRALLLDQRQEMSLLTEAFLFMASRVELVERIIRPALECGAIVLCDRFVLANVVYQGHAGGLDVAELWRLGLLATGGLEPACTFVLDMPVEAAQRRRGRDPDRLEQRSRDYHERVRAGFRTEAMRRPECVRVIDATQTVDTVQAALRTALEPWLVERA